MSSSNPVSSDSPHGMSELTYAERQLGPKGRAVALAHRRWLGGVEGLFFLAAGSIWLLSEEELIARIIGGILAGLAVVGTVAFLASRRRLQDELQSIEEGPEESEACPSLQEEGLDAATRRFRREADRLLRPHVGDYYYAEQQMRRAGEYEALAEKYYQRRLLYLVAGIPALVFLMHSAVVYILIVPILVGFVRAYGVRKAMGQLVRDRDSGQLGADEAPVA